MLIGRPARYFVKENLTFFAPSIISNENSAADFSGRFSGWLLLGPWLVLTIRTIKSIMIQIITTKIPIITRSITTKSIIRSSITMMTTSTTTSTRRRTNPPPSFGLTE